MCSKSHDTKLVRGGAGVWRFEPGLFNSKEEVFVSLVLSNFLSLKFLWNFAEKRAFKKI